MTSSWDNGPLAVKTIKQTNIGGSKRFFIDDNVDGHKVYSSINVVFHILALCCYRQKKDQIAIYLNQWLDESLYESNIKVNNVLMRWARALIHFGVHSFKNAILFSSEFTDAYPSFVSNSYMTTESKFKICHWGFCNLIFLDDSLDLLVIYTPLCATYKNSWELILPANNPRNMHNGSVDGENMTQSPWAQIFGILELHPYLWTSQIWIKWWKERTNCDNTQSMTR